MSGFSQFPKLLKAGLVLIDTGSPAVPLQYNPDTFTRSLQGQVMEGGVS